MEKYDVQTLINNPFKDFSLKFTSSEIREKRNLLILSLINLTVSITNMIPTRINTLGITFTQSHQKMIIYLLLLCTIYVIVSFIFTIIPKAIDYNNEYFYKIELLNNHREIDGISIAQIANINSIIAKIKIYRIVRILFDIWFPISFGSLSVIFLINKIVVTINTIS